MLTGEGNTDDRNAKQEGEDQVDNRCIQAAADDPDDIAQDGQASYRAACGDYLSAERPENETGDLEALQAERDADDRQAKDESSEDVSESCCETAEDKPDEVADEVHALKIRNSAMQREREGEDG